MDKQELVELSESLFIPFYADPGFWFGVILACISIFFSVKAFWEAREAKKAAFEAGKTVKIQTITIELTEIVQRLDKLDFELNFVDARDLLSEVNRRLRRLVAPFQNTEEFTSICDNLKSVLTLAKDALENVRPPDGGDIPANTVYFAMQGHFSAISELVAEIMGLFEKRTIEVAQQ